MAVQSSARWTKSFNFKSPRVETLKGLFVYIIAEIIADKIFAAKDANEKVINCCCRRRTPENEK